MILGTISSEPFTTPEGGVMSDTWVNPLVSDVVTISTVVKGDNLVCFVLGSSQPIRHLTIDSGPYTSDEDDLVIDVIHPDGHVSTELTSQLGLTPGRHNGKWVAIAVRRQN